MNIRVQFALAALVLQFLQHATASQIGIGGSSFEEALTKEPISSRAFVASKLGRFLKLPVHEEITQLAFDCETIDGLADDPRCASPDVPFANAFVIAGVRWNDLPPFRLTANQGAGCKKFFSTSPACNINETVRFSTQPECWYCLFKAASVTAKEKEIAGCNAKPGQAHGNLMTRSHFGDLQFLHAMANADGVDPAVTRKKILDWIEFGWRVAAREFTSVSRLSDVKIDTIKEHFGCTLWTVADLFVLGRNDTKMVKHIPEIALGSILHTIQDSFSAAHVDRGVASLDMVCVGAPGLPHPGPIEEFHGYAKQDGHKHDAEDEREAMIKRTLPGTESPMAVAMSRRIVEYYNDDKEWAEVAPFFHCLFELSATARKSSPGNFRAD